MGGSAVLGTNLVDELVAVADSLRDGLHPEFGVRQFRVYTVLRTYASGSTGDGSFTDVETQLTPQPKVQPYHERILYELDRCGVDEAGFVLLREISLTYTVAELIGPSMASGQEWLIKITDAHGQGIADQYFVVSRKPYPDREKDIGWWMELERASDEAGE